MVILKGNKAEKEMPDHISEYFVKEEGTKEAFHSRELFKADDKNVDLKTDLSFKEIILMNKLIYNNHILKKYQLNPVFDKMIYSYMRLKFSLERKSRGEFVFINKGQESVIQQQLEHLKSLSGARS